MAMSNQEMFFINGIGAGDGSFWLRVGAHRKPKSSGLTVKARLIRRLEAVTSSEDPLSKKVKVVLPFGGIMAVTVHMPHMGNTLLFQVSMHSLADADEPVLVTTSQPEQFQLPRCRSG